MVADFIVAEAGIASIRSPQQRIYRLAKIRTEEPGRTAEAVRRALPELAKLDRYESRAVARRDRAIRQNLKRSRDRISRITYFINFRLNFLFFAKRTQFPLDVP